MTSSTAAAEPAVILSRWPDFSALTALFLLALRQCLRGRRLLVLALLFALPCALTTLLSLSGRHAPTEVLEFFFPFNLIPHALAPLAALLFASGLIRDEAEEQTLTYLLMRPLPRWALYVIKFLAALLVTCLLTGVFTGRRVAVSALTSPELVAEDLIQRSLTTAGALALAQVGYCAIFGCMGLVTKRALLLGV